MIKDIEAWFDGACWPNPNGHASSGAVIKKNGQIIFESSEYIGSENTSNNVAEYHGLICVLKYLLCEVGPCQALIRGDSNLVIKQISGKWKVRNSEQNNLPGAIVKPRFYLPYYREAKRLLDLQPQSKFTFQWIPREQNTEADKLSTAPLFERGFRQRYQ